MDRTFCASPNCKNECGRKLQNEHNHPNEYIWYSYFCGIPDEEPVVSEDLDE